MLAVRQQRGLEIKVFTSLSSNNISRSNVQKLSRPKPGIRGADVTGFVDHVFRYPSSHNTGRGFGVDESRFDICAFGGRNLCRNTDLFGDELSLAGRHDLNARRRANVFRRNVDTSSFAAAPYTIVSSDQVALTSPSDKRCFVSNHNFIRKFSLNVVL